ncbi:MAG: DUF429 domain-containing protein [Actinobacteria bacterium]|nr:MAG: DUF429 domain-containing protein [Actinomycetota bacterium]
MVGKPDAGWSAQQPRRDVPDGTVSIGVDLSTDPKSTALAVIHWRDDGCNDLTFLKRPVEHAELVDVLNGWDYLVAAIDVPFGWPDQFASFIGSHQSNVLGGVPSAGTDEAEEWRTQQLALRATDQYVKKKLGLRPISVGFNLLGATAAAWSLIEAAITSGPADRTGIVLTGDKLIVETYPSAQMHVWNGSAVPEREGVERTMDVIESLASQFSIELGDGRQALTSSPDLRDAFVCALTAGLITTTSQRRPMTDDVKSAQSKREGVIWLHDPTAGALWGK